MTTLIDLIDKVTEQGGKIISTSELTSDEIVLARGQGRMFVDEGGLGFAWIPKDNPTTKSMQVALYKGLSVQRGSDGHWLSFSAEGKHASINIENTFPRSGIIRSAILAWVNGVFSS